MFYFHMRNHSLYYSKILKITAKSCQGSGPHLLTSLLCLCMYIIHCTSTIYQYMEHLLMIIINGDTVAILASIESPFYKF